MNPTLEPALPERPRFRLAALYAAVDAERTRAGLSWAALSGQVGVAAATIKRWAIAQDAEADGVLFLLHWLQAVPEDFVEPNPASAAALDATAMRVRADVAKMHRALDLARRQSQLSWSQVAAELGVGSWASRPSPAGRTTIARLTAAAGWLRLPIAALTRPA